MREVYSLLILFSKTKENMHTSLLMLMQLRALIQLLFSFPPFF